MLPSHQSYENFTNESGSAFSSTTELLQYLLDNYLSFEDIVLFEKNGQKCAFLNTSPIQKQFKRFVVSQNESKLDEISHFFSKEQNNEDIIFKTATLKYDLKNAIDIDMYRGVNIPGYTISSNTSNEISKRWPLKCTKTIV